MSVGIEFRDHGRARHLRLPMRAKDRAAMKAAPWHVDKLRLDLSIQSG
jgi:hypothetical protein